MRWLTFCALALAGGAAVVPAFAQVAAMPRCDPASLSAEEAAFDGYDYTMFQDAYVYYERVRRDGGRWEFILESCPTRDRLTVGVDAADARDNAQRINDVTGPILDAMRGKDVYTFRDLRDLVHAQGIADATLSTPASTSCACAAMGY